MQVRRAERVDTRRRSGRRRNPKRREFFLFLFAQVTLTLKDSREIIPDPTPAQQPRGPRPYGLRREAKPLKGNRLCHEKNQGKGDDVAGLPTVFQFGESSARAVQSLNI